VLERRAEPAAHAALATERKGGGVTDDEDKKASETQELLDLLHELGEAVKARHEIEIAAMDDAIESARLVLDAALACPGAVSPDGLCWAVKDSKGLPPEFSHLYAQWRARCAPEPPAPAPEDNSNLPDAVDMAVPEGMPF
jgi:hypothetical protein